MKYKLYKKIECDCISQVYEVLFNLMNNEIEGRCEIFCKMISNLYNIEGVGDNLYICIKDNALYDEHSYFLKSDTDFLINNIKLEKYIHINMTELNDDGVAYVDIYEKIDVYKDVFNYVDISMNENFFDIFSHEYDLKYGDISPCQKAELDNLITKMSVLLTNIVESNMQ